MLLEHAFNPNRGHGTELQKETKSDDAPIPSAGTNVDNLASTGIAIE